jgi:hypothetical protein
MLLTLATTEVIRPPTTGWLVPLVAVASLAPTKPAWPVVSAPTKEPGPWSRWIIH